MSQDFPKVVQAGSYSDTSFNAIGVQDPFVVKCNSSGTTLLWATYFGGTGTDYGFGIAFDQFFGIYVCGNTVSTDFPVMQPADIVYYQPNHADGGNFNDMWIAWFDVNDALSWSTYFGNSMSNEVYGLSIGMQNEIYMTGVDSNEIAMIKFNPGLPTGQITSSIPELELFLSPNPVGNDLKVQFYSENAGVTQIEIYDAHGRIAQTDVFNAYAGNNQFKLSTSSLAEGVYTIRIVTPDGPKMKRFVKSNIHR